MQPPHIIPLPSSCAFIVVARQFLKTKFETVFDRYNILLRSKNYVTRRQSLKLLGELLLDKANFQVMMRYIKVCVGQLGVAVRGRPCAFPCREATVGQEGA